MQANTIYSYIVENCHITNHTSYTSSYGIVELLNTAFTIKKENYAQLSIMVKVVNSAVVKQLAYLYGILLPLVIWYTQKCTKTH